MYESRSWSSARGSRVCEGRGPLLARERTAAYDVDAADGMGGAGGRLGGLAEALAGLEAALDALAAVDLDAESDRDLLDAALGLHTLGNRHAAAQLAALEAVDRRGAFAHDGAVTTAGWYRTRTRMDAAQASRLVQAAVRLRRLPALAAALAEGAVSLPHVTAVTAAAVPRRIDALAAVEDTLVELARRAAPQQVRVAVRHVADQVDPDGTDPDGTDPDGTDPDDTDDGRPDERRSLQLSPTIEGLWWLRGWLDPVTGELLATVLQAFDQPDPPDTPADRKRSAGQRRVDALAAALRRLLDAGDAPSVDKARPHVLMLCDVATLAGADAAATRPPRLRFFGEIAPALARRIAAQAKITAVQTMGPWRVVNVGRTQRTLPAWLRGLLSMLHRKCRGPDCDRPATWAQAHHVRAWGDGGDTDLNATVPVCHAHHALITNGTWTLDHDPDTGICTWTGPEGQVRITHPPEP